MTNQQRRATLARIEREARAAAARRHRIGDVIGVAVRLGTAGLAKRLRAEFKETT